MRIRRCVPASRGTGLDSVQDQALALCGFGDESPQISVLHGSRRGPALLVTNNLESSLSDILRRYARRWLVELSISEQLAFFDLTVTIVAYNLLRLLTCDLPRYLLGGAREGPAAG